MQELNFKKYSFRFKSKENKPQIFDPIRKKFILLTPEEWVRQHVIKFLIEELQYPPQLINVEKQLNVHQTIKRYDLVVFNPNGSLKILVECKAPKIPISQTVFDQIARYNIVTQAQYLMVTNGISHFYCTLDYTTKKYNFLKQLPPFSRMD